MSLLQDALRKAQFATSSSASPGIIHNAGHAPAERKKLAMRAGAALAVVCLLAAGAYFFRRFTQEAPRIALQQPAGGAVVNAGPTQAPTVEAPVPRDTPNPETTQERTPAAAGSRRSAPPSVPSRAGSRNAHPLPPLPPPAAPRPQHDDRTLAMACYNEGIEAGERNDWEAAARRFRELVGQDPSLIEGWNGLGIALLRQGKTEEAGNAIETALSMDPEYPSALMNEGILRLSEGRNPEAAELFSRSAFLDPGRPAHRVNLAIAQSRQGLLAEAEETLIAARRRFPSDADVLYHLGTVYERMGKRARAAEGYSAFLAVSNGKRSALERSVRERLREWGVE